MNKEISFEDIKDFDEDFNKDRANALAMNAVTSNGINAAAMNHEAAFETEPIVLKPWDPMGSLAI